MRQWGNEAMTARAEVLSRIRRALGEQRTDREADYAAVPREYVRTGALPAAERLQLLTERLEDYNATVHQCPPADVTATIRSVLAGRGKRRMLVPEVLPAEWITEGVELIVDRRDQPDGRLDNEALNSADGVLTGCTVAIALTGSIVLTHTPAEGRRALTLVPDYHLCVIREDQVVETVSEALERAKASNPSVLTTIAGPSATADIEMTRIKGVHGPRTLEVILVVDHSP